MAYPHWLIGAGVILLVLGLIGFAFRQNKNGVPPKPKAKGK
jgi:hypothetical protein